MPLGNHIFPWLPRSFYFDAPMGFFDGLPSGWASAKDAKGVTYYYNRETGNSQWEEPAELKP